MATSKQAQLKALQAANAEAIEFTKIKVEMPDGKKLGAHQLLTAMGKRDDESKNAKEMRDAASMAFCLFAESVAEVNDASEIPRDTIVMGFTKHLDSLRPILSKEGSPFVEATEATDTKPAGYKWKGYGNNVKSIAKGVVEFTGTVVGTDEETDEEIMFPEVSDCDSYRKVREAVEAARRGEESEDARLLREAKEAFREACKVLQAALFASKDAELIELRTLDVETITETVNQEAAEQKAIAEAVEKVKEDAILAQIEVASAEAEARDNPASDENIDDTLEAMAAES